MPRLRPGAPPATRQRRLRRAVDHAGGVAPGAEVDHVRRPPNVDRIEAVERPTATIRGSRCRPQEDDGRPCRGHGSAGRGVFAASSEQGERHAFADFDVLVDPTCPRRRVGVHKATCEGRRTLCRFRRSCRPRRGAFRDRGATGRQRPNLPHPFADGTTSRTSARGPRRERRADRPIRPPVETDAALTTPTTASKAATASDRWSTAIRCIRSPHGATTPSPSRRPHRHHCPRRRQPGARESGRRRLRRDSRTPAVGGDPSRSCRHGRRCRAAVPSASVTRTPLNA